MLLRARRERPCSSPEVTAPQQQWPVYLDQRTLRTHQMGAADHDLKSGREDMHPRI
jgi:hypothetical protein